MMPLVGPLGLFCRPTFRLIVTDGSEGYDRYILLYERFKVYKVLSLVAKKIMWDHCLHGVSAGVCWLKYGFYKCFHL